VSKPLLTGTWVPSLPDHCNNSLFGALFSIARFNLCSALEIARIVDALAASELAHLKPPSVIHLTVFMRWAACIESDIHRLESDFLIQVLARARQDLDEVPAEWLLAALRCCPQCAKTETHLIAHQHRAIHHCPVHEVPLRGFCDYCGMERRYRIVRGTRFLYCSRCMKRAGYRYWENDKTVSLLATRGIARQRQIAQAVLIAGLPNDDDPLHACGISPQDLRCLYAEGYLDPRQRSAQSQVLDRYFRFLSPPLADSAAPFSHLEGVHRVLKHVRFLAMMTGHDCLDEPPGDQTEDDLRCPCQVGFQLWAWRVHEGLFARQGPSARLNAEQFESAHLGLCLSVAWFAHTQWETTGDLDAYRMLLRFLEPKMVRVCGSEDRAEDDAVELGLLCHQHQWSAIRCPRPNQRVARMVRKLASFDRGATRAEGSDTITDVAWIMSMASPRPA
jgi:hypothetical protein